MEDHDAANPLDTLGDHRSDGPWIHRDRRRSGRGRRPGSLEPEDAEGVIVEGGAIALDIACPPGR